LCPQTRELEDEKEVGRDSPVLALRRGIPRP